MGGEALGIHIGHVGFDAPVLVLAHVDRGEPADDFGGFTLERLCEGDAFGVLGFVVLPFADFGGAEGARLEVLEPGAGFQVGETGAVEDRVGPGVEVGVEVLLRDVRCCGREANVAFVTDVKRCEADGNTRGGGILLPEEFGLLVHRGRLVRRVQFHGVELSRIQSFGWVSEADVRLVLLREVVVVWGAFTVGRPLGRVVVQHDGLEVELGGFHFVQAVFGEHVVIDLLPVPVIGWPAQRLVNGFFIPRDLRKGAFMFMDSTQRMAELMQDDSADVFLLLVLVDPSQVHGWFPLTGNVTAVGAQVGPGSQARVEVDQDIALSVGNELHGEIGMFAPEGRKFLDLILLPIGPGDEGDP